MFNGRIIELFRIRERFLRSVQLERDFEDSTALQGYVVTPHVRSGLERIISGLAADSGQRAWRITGDYGSGKSSFALALAHLVAGREPRLPEQLRQVIDFRSFGARPKLLPVLVTGSRGSMAVAVIAALRRSVDALCIRGKPAQIVGRLRAMDVKAAKTPPSDEEVLSMIDQIGEYLVASQRATGVLLILDELGKFLEFAAIHPDRQDIFFLQRLAESASRSGPRPLFVVGLLHQGFNAYADQLSEPAQREWEKVAGRFDEMVSNQPLEQTAELVADAIDIRVDRLPHAIVRQARADMNAILDAGWYGPAAARNRLLQLAPRLYPLHPTVLPVLSRVFHRVGQNERSLFSFLFSTEPFGMRTFGEQPVKNAGFYRLHHLYDYTRSCFGNRLAVLSYRSHWNHIESMVESFPVDRATDVCVLKTVGLLNLLDTPPLLASEQSIELCVGAKEQDKSVVQASIHRLEKRNRVLYFRGIAGGYCLWPHTSVNLDDAYRSAEREIAPAVRIAPLIGSLVEPRPLVARRHYIETGNLRYFRVRYAAVSDLAKCLAEPLGRADGMILVALCETPLEREEALRFANAPDMAERPEVLFAVPAPLASLRGLMLQAQRWDWVARNIPELGNDPYAAEEVSRQVVAAQRALQERVHTFLGLGKTAAQSELKWFRQNRSISIGDGRDLLAKLSAFCKEMFPAAPHVRNELLNRHELSSAAAAARMRLIERLLTTPTLPLLGMDPAKKPPEMSMYLSVLKRGGLHQEIDGAHDVMEPSVGSDALNLLPSLRCIHDVLCRQPDSRIRVPRILEELARPPYGVRAGLAPLLLAIFAAIHEQEVAFYSNDAFVRCLTGQDFMRLVKAPELFEIQFCRITGVRAALFARLSTLLNADRPKERTESLLDVVRTLCVFAAQLPTFTLKTRRLPPSVIAVRDALAAAKEPAILIFHDLPRACGFEPFSSDTSANDALVAQFVSTLKSALEELKAAHPELLHRIKADVVAAFNFPGTFEDVRRRLADTASNLLGGLAEPRLKSLCLRLADRGLAETEWIESLGSLICAKPPAKWLDFDADQFSEELHRLAAQFRRVEATAFIPGASDSVRLSITLPNGSDAVRVVHLTPDEELEVRAMETQFSALLAPARRIGMAAAARVLWKEMQNS